MNSDEENRERDLESAEKRAHHNALERKRRDHIKDSFSSLRDAVPSLQGEKVASRAQILKKAADYIQHIRKRNCAHLQDIDDLKRQNSLLEAQIRTLENSRTPQVADVDEKDGSYSESDSDEEVEVVNNLAKLNNDYVPA